MMANDNLLAAIDRLVAARFKTISYETNLKRELTDAVNSVRDREHRAEKIITLRAEVENLMKALLPFAEAVNQR